MSDDSGTGTTGDENGGDPEGVGPTQIPGESPSSESELALSDQVARREGDEGQDDS